VEGDKGEGIPVGLLKASTAVVFNTSNTTGERERTAFGDPLEAIWKHCIFDLCGVRNFHRRTFSVIITSSVDQRRQWLREAVELVSNVIPPTRVGDPAAVRRGPAERGSEKNVMSINELRDTLIEII
jgi:hypothetical protein